MEEEITNIKTFLLNLEKKFGIIEGIKSQLDVINNLLKEKIKEPIILSQKENNLKLASQKESISRNEIIVKMKEILAKTLHNVLIVVPDMSDLQDLNIFELKANINKKIAFSYTSCYEEDWNFLDELESLDAISLRDFDAKDRYVLLRDGEELLFVARGSYHLIIHTKDPTHIKLFNNLAMEAWTQGKKR